MQMLLQTNSYIVPKERRAEHTRLLRRFRQILLRIGCDQFEVYEQMGANWTTGDATGRFVQIMRFRDRRHQRQVHAAEQTDPAAQQLIAEFCELINLPYQQQQGLLAVGYYQSVIEPTLDRRGQDDAVPDEGAAFAGASLAGAGFGGAGANSATSLGAAAIDLDAEPEIGEETAVAVDEASALDEAIPESEEASEVLAAETPIGRVESALADSPIEATLEVAAEEAPLHTDAVVEPELPADAAMTTGLETLEAPSAELHPADSRDVSSDDADFFAALAEELPTDDPEPEAVVEDEVEQQALTDHGMGLVEVPAVEIPVLAEAPDEVSDEKVEMGDGLLLTPTADATDAGQEILAIDELPSDEEPTVVPATSEPVPTDAASVTAESAADIAPTAENTPDFDLDDLDFSLDDLSPIEPMAELPPIEDSLVAEDAAGEVAGVPEALAEEAAYHEEPANNLTEEVGQVSQLPHVEEVVEVPVEPMEAVAEVTTPTGPAEELLEETGLDFMPAALNGEESAADSLRFLHTDDGDIEILYESTHAQ